jgi:hypothetical protein
VGNWFIQVYKLVVGTLTLSSPCKRNRGAKFYLRGTVNPGLGRTLGTFISGGGGGLASEQSRRALVGQEAYVLYSTL